MTVRSFNYSGRKRINREHVQIRINGGNGRPVNFDADLKLEKYKFPDDALVFIEAYRQTLFMRFSFGEIGNIQIPRDRVLSFFDSPEHIRFRLRITRQDDKSGLLLGEADHIRPVEDDEEKKKRIPLLPVRPDSELGDQIFKVSFEGDMPFLLINSAVDDWRSLSRDPRFMALVYPEAFRFILTKILLIEKHFDNEEMSDWKSQWLFFCNLLPGINRIPDEKNDEDEVNDWINDAVNSFCRHQGFFENFKKNWGE